VLAGKFGHGLGHPPSGLLDGRDRDRGLALREVVVERSLRRAAGVDDVVETGACEALPAEQPDGGVDDRRAVLGDGWHEALPASRFREKLY
jgi:hypothetical protein